MGGVFQMFDRQHLAAGHGRRRRRLPSSSGHPLSNATIVGAEEPSLSSSPHIVLERVSVESSRTSSSSSSSSSFSSLKCNRSVEQEPPDIRDVTNNTIHGGSCNPLVKTLKQEKARWAPMSLDGSHKIGCRAGAMQPRRLSYDLRSSFYCRPPVSSTESVEETSCISQRKTAASDAQQGPASYKRHPGIVAKLMGLDALPNLDSGSQEMMESAPNCIRHSNSIGKSKHPIETAPWKQQAPGFRNARIKQPPTSLFRDLRALKQILGSMQAKGLLETKKSSKFVKSNAVRTFKSPIVIMKPSKSANLSCFPASSSITSSEGLSGLPQPRKSDHTSSKIVKDQTANCNPRSNRSEVNASLVKNPCSTRPRLQQRKINADRKSCPPVPCAELSKNRRCSAGNNSLDSASPRNRLRRGTCQEQQQYDQCSERSSGTKRLSYQKSSHYLDENLPPPKIKISNAHRGRTPDKLPVKPGSEFDHTLADDEGSAADHMALLYETSSPDHRYVSEILLASGLLMKDLVSGQAAPMAAQLHTSGHLINPDLFLVLEQGRPVNAQENANRVNPNAQKLHRELLFDLVNELLTRKLDARSIVVRRGITNGLQLLRELCSEIEQLRSEKGSCENDGNVISGQDLLQNVEGWTQLDEEMSGIVLNIERCVFKDLVDEVVAGEGP